MKSVRCANCGLELQIFRKALPRRQAIITCVAQHECLETPLELDLPVNEFKPQPAQPVEGKQKFIEKLNELEPPRSRFSGFGTDDLHDRRAEEPVKDSSAPANLLRQMRNISADPGDEPND